MSKDDEIRNQENLLLIGNRIKALLDQYPKNEGLRTMSNAFTEVCIYSTGLELEVKRLELTIEVDKEKFINNMGKLLKRWK